MSGAETRRNHQTGAIGDKTLDETGNPAWKVVQADTSPLLRQEQNSPIAALPVLGKTGAEMEIG